MDGVEQLTEVQRRRQFSAPEVHTVQTHHAGTTVGSFRYTVFCASGCRYSYATDTELLRGPVCVGRCYGMRVSVCLSVRAHNNNSNNNNNHDDIYSAVIMTEVIARVHSVHLMNVEQRQAAADPQTEPPDSGCESACFRQLASTTTSPFIIVTQPES